MTSPAPSMTPAWPRGFASATTEPGPRSEPRAASRTSPGHRPETVDVPAGSGRGRFRGQADDRVGSLGDGLGAAVPVEVGGGVAGIGGVEPDVWHRLRV